MRGGSLTDGFFVFFLGGECSHVHIAQSSSKALGGQSADNWESATSSALAGTFTSPLIPIPSILFFLSLLQSLY